MKEFDAIRRRMEVSPRLILDSIYEPAVVNRSGRRLRTHPRIDSATKEDSVLKLRNGFRTGS
jgi:hypothetical protein